MFLMFETCNNIFISGLFRSDLYCEFNLFVFPVFLPLLL